MEDNEASRAFRALIEDADRSFSRVRDLPPYARAQGHAFQKVFKAYTKLWKFQIEKRAALVDSGLKRWEIGEIASRIGQLYFNQYMRTSDPRFLYEAYVFYDAIVRRRYFEDKGGKSKDLVAVKFKELRFYARFLVVCLMIERGESIEFLMLKFRSLVDDCKGKIREANYREWKAIVDEAVRFIESNDSPMKPRSLRYSVAADVHPDSQLYVARFHSRKVQKFTDAILTSYHTNEVKFADITLDTYRMLQCLEWETSILRECSDAFPKYPSEGNVAVPNVENSGTSVAIDMHLSAEMYDPSLPPNPRKIVLFRPSVTQLLAAIAAVCEELKPECIMLLYLSADKSESDNSFTFDSVSNGKKDISGYDDGSLWFGPKRNEGQNMLFPGDIIPFTRKPLFLIVDSNNSFAFKLLHGAERGEPAALLLSAKKQTIKINGHQFTFFLTSPIEAFCQMVGFDQTPEDKHVAEEILGTCISEWEVILCTSKSLDIVWAQVLSDPFLRRILLRFIFCRCALALFRRVNDNEAYVPTCLPRLPNSVSPVSETVLSGLLRMAKHFDVVGSFRL